MEIQKRLQELHDEVAEISIEKRDRIEFMSGTMAGHQHRVSLHMTKGKLTGNTERVNGHIHKVDLAFKDNDLLGFTDSSDNHKHRLMFKIKTPKEEEKKPNVSCR